LILFAIIIIASNLWVELSTRKQVYSSIDSLPKNKVGLLLGTSKFLKSGGINPYYQYRITATAELLKHNKIEYVIVSGDNSTLDYNEPRQMKLDLIRMGIDPSKIILDYAGFRTLDSVIRSREVFGQFSITFISQSFHNKRAIFIANNKNIRAIGFNARDLGPILGIKVQFRELFARVKLMIDLFLINKQPKYLGEKILIGN
jgi:SanA protein